MIKKIIAILIIGMTFVFAEGALPVEAAKDAGQVIVKFRLLDVSFSGDFTPDKKPLLARYPWLEKETKQLEGVQKIDFIAELELVGASSKELKGQSMVPAFFIKNEGERQKQDADLVVTATPVKNNGKIDLKYSLDAGLNQKSAAHLEGNLEIAYGNTVEAGYLMKPKNGNDKTITLVLVTAYPKCEQPRCKDYPWIGKLKAYIADKKDKAISDYRETSLNDFIVVDWREDVPACGSNGIFSYNVYRDNKPISGLRGRKPFAADIPGDAVTYIDDSQKDKGAAYYYVVTAVAPDGQEQAISPNGSFSAAVIMSSK